MKTQVFRILAGVLMASLAGCSGTSVPNLAQPLSRPLAPAAQSGPALSALTVGSFNLTRGGIESLANTDENGLRGAILRLFPGTRFRYAGTLTVAFLSTVKVVVIGVAAAPTTPIMALSSSEQTALVNFVKAGHTALILVDNDLQFQTASTSLLAPFGLSSTGVLDNDQKATFLSRATDPIRSGPAGTATGLDTSWPAWFNKLGTSVELAKLSANGMPALAYTAPGKFSAGSGAVVFFADSSLMVDGIRTSNDRIALLNALALTK